MVPDVTYVTQSFLLGVSLWWWGIWEKHKHHLKNTRTKKRWFFSKVFWEDREGSHFTHNKANILETLFKYFSPMFQSSWHFPYPSLSSPLSQTHSQLPTIIFHNPSDCTQLDKAGQIVLSKIKSSHVSFLKHGLGALSSQHSQHVQAYAHVHTHWWNPSISPMVTWCNCH